MGYNNLKQQLSTGNTLQDILLAGGIGFAQNFNPKGWYYTQSNWKGDGLANSGVGYVGNNRYTNYVDVANVLSSMLGDNNTKYKNNSIYNLSNNVLSKLSGIKGKVGDWASNQWSNMVNRKYGNTGDFYNNHYGIG